MVAVVPASAFGAVVFPDTLIVASSVQPLGVVTVTV